MAVAARLQAILYGAGVDSREKQRVRCKNTRLRTMDACREKIKQE